MLQNQDALQSFNISDFTESHYVELLKLAKLNYQFTHYDAMNPSSKFILWRHDCDISLNRALRIAAIERELDITSTYFLNPHCEFYNLLEADQSRLVKQMISMGHSIGLHFESAYYDITSESQLDALIKKEASWLEQWFETPIKVFSFHNPMGVVMNCEKEYYGGLINCYSDFFKTKVPYCSDSNGYWRFRRLEDVLKEASDPCLQVLTHPDWWQENPMPPRDRVIRAVEGRAMAVVTAYDNFLTKHGRTNVK